MNPFEEVWLVIKTNGDEHERETASLVNEIWDATHRHGVAYMWNNDHLIDRLHQLVEALSPEDRERYLTGLKEEPRWLDWESPLPPGEPNWDYPMNRDMRSRSNQSRDRLNELGQRGVGLMDFNDHWSVGYGPEAYSDIWPGMPQDHWNSPQTTEQAHAAFLRFQDRVRPFGEEYEGSPTEDFYYDMEQQQNEFWRPIRNEVGQLNEWNFNPHRVEDAEEGN
jgi:hypothetical protein